MTSMIVRARSLLFVPASRPDRFGKALESGADCVILDLEDAVPTNQKVQARTSLANRLEGFTREQLDRTLVRINAAGTAWHDDDVRLLAQWTARGLAGAMVAKAEMPAQIQAVGEALGANAQLLPLVESMAGLDAADLLARVPSVVRLVFGHLDFQLDLGMRCGAEEVELTYARFVLVAASRRANLAPPVDGVTVDTSSPDRLKADVARARAFGFGGKLCIHPSQVPVVAESFTPSMQEVAWARRVVDEAGKHKGEAFSMNGRMVDLPVVRLAQRTLQQLA